VPKGFFCLHNFTLVGEEEAKLFRLEAGTSKVTQRKNSGFGFLSKRVEKIFTLDNFGAIITMGFESKGDFDPSSRFHSVNAIQHN